jgi:hypothetical protein
VTIDHAELLTDVADTGSNLLNLPTEITAAPSLDRLSEQEQQVSLQLYAAILLLLIMAAEWEVYRRGLSG